MLQLIAVRLADDLHQSVDGSAVRASLVAGQLQAANVPIAYTAVPQPECYSRGWDRQTGGLRYRLMSPPHGGGHKKDLDTLHADQTAQKRAIWLPTEWNHQCVWTPVERDGVVGFRQFCIIFLLPPHQPDCI